MTTETLSIKIDKDLKREFKIVALKQDVTITEILTTYIQKYVNENK